MARPAATARPAAEDKPEAKKESEAPARAAPRTDSRPEVSAPSSFGGLAASRATSGADDDETPRVAPYEGRFADVMRELASDVDKAADLARAWHAEQPGDVLALVALGEVAEAQKQDERAARAYGSIVDLFPNRADLRRFAGERLDRVASRGDAAALELAVDTYAKAVEDRPDHPSSHRLLAFALLRKKQYAKAFDAVRAGMRRGYDDGRFEGASRVLAEDAGLVAAAWAAAEPARRQDILASAAAAGARVEGGPSLRFVLVWETDANDVDFHIHDGKGGHAFFSEPRLASGGELYADVTTGYGPECFTIRAPKQRRAAPYHLYAHYYARGPMGYGMGKLEIVEHDGRGNLTFEERPFVVMTDGAFVDLGRVP